MKEIILALVFLLPLSGITQDPEFTQFYANPIYLNPALAGAEKSGRLNFNYRNQWAKLPGAYVTNSVAYDQFVSVLHGGIGINITNDIAGNNVLNTSTINLVYSYHLEVSRNFTLLFGAQATWNQRFLDWSKLTFGDQIDPFKGFVLPTGDLPSGLIGNTTWSTKGYFDVSTGIVGYSENFYIGFAGKHLNTPEQSIIINPEGDSKLPIRYTGHLGAKIPLKSSSIGSFLSPNVIFTQQNYFQQLSLGMYLSHGAFTAGAWWRTDDAFILSIGGDAGKFRVGYSYDLTISRLTNATGGSHELSLTFLFPNKQRSSEYRTIVCPSF